MVEVCYIRKDMREIFRVINEMEAQWQKYKNLM
jgi:hypothetical protein